MRQIDKIFVEVNVVSFAELDQWTIDDSSGHIIHNSGKFFSIIGIDVSTNWGDVKQWTQPIIKQPEIGILGIIAKKKEGVWRFLMQAKVEPGNLNHVQISPTLQATKSNYTRVHQGKEPAYLSYFQEVKLPVIIDQLQSEQGSMFMAKRNRNIVIEVNEEIPVYENFCWMTLEEIVAMLNVPNTVNMDTRSAISGLIFLGDDKQEHEKGAHQSFYRIVQWLAKLKSHYELKVREISLYDLQNWIVTDDCIQYEEEKYFEVIPVKVTIEGRETTTWSQPMIKAKHEGLCAFILKKINGIYHLLIQGKVECGNFDIVEMAPTVQCLTGDYRAPDSKKPPYLDYVSNASRDQIVYDVMQSEEGGRFYHEQNRNMIVIADESFTEEVPENYIWITLRQVHMFIMFNNFFNIQARSLIAALVTKENEYA